MIADKSTIMAELEAARKFLAMYSSPFPDAQERAIKAKQREYIKTLEKKLIQTNELQT